MIKQLNFIHYRKLKNIEIEFSKEVLKKQYITIAELIELNAIKRKINLV